MDGTVRRHGFTFNDAGLPYQATAYSDTSGSTVLTQDLVVTTGLVPVRCQDRPASERAGHPM